MLNVFFMYPQIANFKYLKNNMIQLFGFFIGKGTKFFKLLQFDEGSKKFK